MLVKKAIIFDLNGVFIKSPKLSDRFRDDFNVPEKEFMPALLEIMQKVRRPGSMDVFLLWRPYLKKWEIDFSKDQFFDYWFGKEGVDETLFEFALELKKMGYKIFILSNNFIERAKYYEKEFPELFDKMGIFDRVYYSWQTGFVKPDKRAFELLLKENDLNPTECLYFDDSLRNIESAAELGIESYLFDGIEDIKTKLNFNKWSAR